MRLSSIMNLGMSYLMLGVVGIVVMAVLLAVGYFLVYKKLLKGSKGINKRKLILSAVFFCYFIVVAGGVFLDRGSHYNSAYDLQLFNSYLEAWNSFSKIAWREIILNILMLVPFGILLPLWADKFKTFWKTFLAGLCMTLIIEVGQLIMKKGIFDLDDIFDNTLGVVIGYGLIMIIFVVKKDVKKKGLKVAACLLPLVFTVGVFLSIFAVYSNQEFGNLSENYAYRVDMKGTNISSDKVFDDEQATAKVYSSKVASKEESYEFAQNFFRNFDEKIDDSRTDVYDDTIIYHSENDSSSIWIDYKGMTFNYRKHAHHDSKTVSAEDKATSVADENTIREALKVYGIDIPNEAVGKPLNNQYIFEVSMVKSGDKIVNGKISCEYTDGKVWSINNELVEYNPVKECEIISEAEAYEHIKEGKFKGYLSYIKSMDVKGVKLDYVSDSKGFFQPVYRFQTSVDGQDLDIVIPALK